MTANLAFEGRISKAAFIVSKTQSTLCTLHELNNNPP